MDPNDCGPSTSKAAADAAKKKKWYGGQRWQNRNFNGPPTKSASIPIPMDSIPAAQPQNSIIPTTDSSNSEEYLGWKLYFTTETFVSGSTLHSKIILFENHIMANPNEYDLFKTKQELWFPVVLQFVLNDEQIQLKWSSFEQDIREKPRETLNCLSLAMHQRCLMVPDRVAGPSQSQPNPTSSSSIIQQQQRLLPVRPPNLHMKCIVARLTGCGPIVNLRSLIVANYGRLITVRGTIIRVNESKIICSWLAFQCSTCSASQTLKLIDGIMAYPKTCKTTGCRARSNFQVLKTSPYTRTETLQTLRLQESMQGIQFDSGRVPRTMEIELKQDLVDSMCPGDDVTVTGILNVRSTNENQFNRKTLQPSMYRMYLEGVSFVSNKSVQFSRKNELTEKDRLLITMIKAEPCPFRLMIHSLCPPIYGHEMVKAGLILGLFGGAKPQSQTTSDNPPKETDYQEHRTEAHVLVVGDPGVGKSKMLQACSNVAPRSIFIGGNTCTNAGLTVSIRHDKNTGGSLEAGALVLADQGVCCIDEFDNMSANHQSLLEVMESQTVSVAKAGVLCTLPARTCVLAAANPSGGHYNKGKTVSENLKMKPALLSRFDLIFVLLDRPDPHLDNLLTAHIQSLHNAKNKTNNPWSSTSSRCQSNSNDNATANQQSTREPLRERLKLSSGEKIEVLPHVLMQKYIGYARKNIHPVLSSDANAVLKEFYLQLRQENVGVESIPVTVRQLEALVRLTQARARVDLAKIATFAHAQDVVEISKHSMADVFSTDVGTLNMTRNINGVGMSQQTQIKKFLKILQTKVLALNKTVFTNDELKEFANSGGLIGGNFNQIIDSLNLQGILLKKGRNLYKFIADS